MRNNLDDLKDPHFDHCTHQPNRSEIADIWMQLSFPDGFSMEWVFDHFERNAVQLGGCA